MLNLSNLKIEDYLGKIFLCDCGKNHRVDIKSIIIEDHGLNKLSDTLLSIDRLKPFIVYDSTTYPLLGNKLESLLGIKNIPFSSYIIHQKRPIPDEKTIGEVLIHFDKTCDVMIAVGSGTMNDICRFISYQLNIPYIIVATAPSMDGYASNVAALLKNKMKTTFEAHMPIAILGDTSVLNTAPIEMIVSGIGDILGKYTSLCDWELSHLINEEYQCSRITAIVNRAIQTTVDQIDYLPIRKTKVIEHVMISLLLTGIAMSYAGNSRPASGSEHHLSHYWEMIHHLQGKKPILHGTKVGIGTLAIVKAYEFLNNQVIDFDKARYKARDFSFDTWEQSMKKLYFNAADSVITLEKEIGKNKPANVIKRINILEEKWDLIKETISKLPTSEDLYNKLSRLNAPTTPQSIDIEKETFLNSFLVAKELRNRYGILQILFDLGLGEETANHVWEYFEDK